MRLYRRIHKDVVYSLAISRSNRLSAVRGHLQVSGMRYQDSLQLTPCNLYRLIDICAPMADSRMLMADG